MIRCRRSSREHPPHRPALKGPLATPVGGGFRSVNVRLREEFGLYANLRPARTLVPGGRYEDIDIVLVRENLEGLYVAWNITSPSATIRTRSRSPRASTRARAAASPNSPSTTPSGTSARRSPSCTRRTSSRP